MNVQRYLSRIKFKGNPTADLNTLRTLHKLHLLNIPFEDLDIHYKRPFDLNIDKVYSKIVDNHRGGFCYEVNSLFNELLKEIGFKTKIIAGKVIKENGEAGPRYDHMAIVVDLDKRYLVDVGFGDLFIEPLEVREGTQDDGRNIFRIDRQKDQLAIFMNDEKKYIFSLDETPVSSFDGPCRDKQVNPDSHFVKNIICSMLTWQGRITVFNDKFIEKIAFRKEETLIKDDSHLKEILESRFGITI